ncbi:MAG: hypothetical protein NT126_10850 [Bacteroidetes bacterium]|nr:hypothetical protein [Bacteroidota bacterium]
MITTFLLFSSMAKAQGPQLFGFNTKDAHLITIINNSGDSANDFHLKVKVPLPGMGGIPIIKKVVFVPGGPGQKGAFRDTTFSPPGYQPNSFDWGPGSNNFKIPPGGGFRIQLWGNGYDKDSTFLTHNGTPITTNGLKVRNEINKGGNGSGTMKIKNEDGSGIILQNVVMHINNTNFPFDSVVYSPNGSMVPGIPNSMLINPGDSVMYPYSGNLPGNWITLDYMAARISSPSVVYEMGAAANDVVANAIPAMTLWGTIIMFVMLVSLGVFFLKVRRN